MLSLQNRIALILVASMMAVLALGLSASFLILTDSDPSPPEPVADLMVLLSSATVLKQVPPNGVLLLEPTRKLQQELKERGVSGKVSVIDEDSAGRRIAVYQLASGQWVTLDAAEDAASPTGAWLALSVLFAIAVFGVGTIALIVARRVTEPFDIIERAVASVDPSGELPQLPVDGSAEARQVKAALNSLSRRLKTAMQSRIRLVAAAGHDLRTPMTRMRLRAELLPEDEQMDWLTDVDELEQIAESAIGLVKEESGFADRTAVDMASLVKETVYDLAGSDLPVRLGALQQATVLAGPLSLRRALRNLIINAATHGGARQSRRLVWGTPCL